MSLPGPDEVHAFWFGDVSDWRDCVRRNNERWFREGRRLDTAVRERFAALLDAAAGNRLGHWPDTPRSALARVITLDQFPRHVHRGRPEAFAFDPLARAACEAGIERGHDRALSPVERAFFYLPLEHAEDRRAQVRCVELMREAARGGDPALAPFMAEALRHAELHQDIVARFGRFPHRNAALGRDSTPAERAWLEQGGPSFGQ